MLKKGLGGKLFLQIPEAQVSHYTSLQSLPEKDRTAWAERLRLGTCTSLTLPDCVPLDKLLGFLRSDVKFPPPHEQVDMSEVAALSPGTLENTAASERAGEARG